MSRVPPATEGLAAVIQDLQRQVAALGAMAVRPEAARSIGRGVVAWQIATTNDLHPNVAATTGEVDTDLVLTPTVDGTRLYKVSLYTELRWEDAAVTTTGLIVKFTVDAADTARFERRSMFDFGFTSAATTEVISVASSVLWTPSSGTPTCRVRLANLSGTPRDIDLIGGATLPRYFWVEDIGPR